MFIKEQTEFLTISTQSRHDRAVRCVAEDFLFRHLECPSHQLEPIFFIASLQCEKRSIECDDSLRM